MKRFLDRITEFAKEFDSDIVIPLDVAEDSQLEQMAGALKRKMGVTLTVPFTPIGFAPREAIQGDFLDGLSRESFKNCFRYLCLFFSRRWLRSYCR